MDRPDTTPQRIELTGAQAKGLRQMFNAAKLQVDSIAELIVELQKRAIEQRDKAWDAAAQIAGFASLDAAELQGVELEFNGMARVLLVYRPEGTPPIPPGPLADKPKAPEDPAAPDQEAPDNTH